MARREIIQYKSNGALLWTTPLALIVSAPGALLVAVAVLIAVRWHPSADGHLGTATLVIGCFGGTAMIVGIGCRIEAAVHTRGEAMSVADHRPPSHETVQRERVVFRRRNGAAYYVFTAACLLIPVVVASTSFDVADYGSAPEPATAGILLAGGGLAALLLISGLMSWFVITPDHVRIDSLLRRTWIPRRLVDVIEPSGSDLRFELADGRSRRFRVDSPLADVGSRYRTNRAAQIRTLDRIERALASVPEHPSTGDADVIERVRPVLAAMVAILLLASIAGDIVVALYWSTLPTG